MKVCEVCGEEIGTKDGDNRCESCHDLEFLELLAKEQQAKKRAQRAKANKQRRERDAAMRGIGMTKVRGALGGTYWE